MPKSLDLDRIAIVGLGLIGGSIARGLKQAGFAGECVGAVADEAERQKACELAIVDRVEIGAARAAAGADLVVIAVPLGAMSGVFAELAGALDNDCVITDVGSAKVDVMTKARDTFGEHWGHFVPGHPIAGTERNGLDAGFASLFEDRRVVLTPDDQTANEATARVTALWQTLGAHVETLAAATHDRLLAATSHVPHALAFTLVDLLASGDDADAVFDYAAGGFADFTRIAASDPVVWRDIFAANRDPVVAALDGYIDALVEMRQAIASDDRITVFERIERARHARNSLPSVPRQNS